VCLYIYIYNYRYRYAEHAAEPEMLAAVFGASVLNASASGIAMYDYTCSIYIYNEY